MRIPPWDLATMKSSILLLGGRRLFLSGFVAFFACPSMSVSAQSLIQSDPIAIYRAASDALAKQEYLLASELFNQVALLRPGTPLAIDAGYYDLIARTKRAESALPEESEELSRQCAQWFCDASAFLASNPTEKFADFAEKLRKKMELIHGVEVQIAFASQQWSRALQLLDMACSPRMKTVRDPASGDMIQADSIRWELMRLECCIHLQRWQEAEELAERLQTSAEENLAHPSPPSWVESFLLRRAEVAMVLGKWKVAESDVWKIRTHFPECKVSSQVDYVLARCLVHETRFEEARQLLASILASQPEPSAPLRIKAWWIIAETHLMQRNFPDAIAAYEQVADLGAGSSWVELAQRQMAICHQASDGLASSVDDSSNDVPFRSTQKQAPKRSR